ncbi:MAG: GGDEF domain-containing protein, partial [Nitriliruptoraceae bacterium]
EQSQQNQHQALHDQLTGLPNRSLFSDRLDQAVVAAERAGERFGVMLMDLDRFKEVNDTLGHHHGDVLLARVAERLRDTLRAGDTVARLGGDEFAFLLPAIGLDADIDVVATKIRDALERPF